MIPAYNCSRYLVLAIESVLAQDPGLHTMQIEVVDDCSSDTDVEKLVQQIGKGRVSYFRQQKNIGSLRNFETCINRARGCLVHILHGDDMIKPGFYREIEQLFTQFPEAGAAFTGHTNIGINGNFLENSRKLSPRACLLENWLYRIAKAQRIQPPSIVVKREVYEKLGSFYAVRYGEDWEMWVRIAASFPVAYSPRHLGLYRIHHDNITSQSLLSGQSVLDIIKVIGLNERHLPEEKRKEITSFAKRHCSRYFAHASDKVYHHFHNPQKALELARQARALDLNFTTFFYVLKNRIKILLHYKDKQGSVQETYPPATETPAGLYPVLAMGERKGQEKITDPDN
jgi:glycosyltransferase involved in cell wall biosynthesis